MDTWFKVGVVASVFGALFCAVSTLVAIAMWYAIPPPAVLTGIPVTLPIVIGVSGVALLVFTWVALYLSYKAIRTAPQQQALAPANVPPPTFKIAEQGTPGRQGRIVIDDDPAYLMGLFKGLTNVQGQKLAEPYIGKWVRITAPLGSATSISPDLVQVTTEADPQRPMTAVFMRFGAPWIDHFSTLRKGRVISAIG